MMPTTTQILAFFNLFAGVMLTLSLILFFGGFVLYLVRLGTWPTYREEAVAMMMWGVSMLFALVLILAVQQFLLRHTLVAAVVAALIVIGLLLWAVSTASAGGGKSESDAGNRH